MTDEWAFLQLDPDSGRLSLGPKYIDTTDVASDLRDRQSDRHDRIVGSVDEGVAVVISDEGQSDVLVYVRLAKAMQQEARDGSRR